MLGQTPPASVLNFEQLLLLVADVYAADPLHMLLADEYWRQSTATGGDGNESMGGAQPTALYKFVRHCGKRGARAHTHTHNCLFCSHRPTRARRCTCGVH